MSLIARGLAAWQRRPGAAEPGDVDRRIVPRCLAQRQLTPDSHRGLGLLDILKKCKFAVKAAPAAGLEQFGEVLQPLLGKTAPARHDAATACHVALMCHDPARKERKRTRTQRGRIDQT